MTDCLQYLEKLVSFPTVSDTDPARDRPNLPLVEWAREEFARLGFATEVIDVAPGKACLLAHKGPLLGRKLGDRGGLLLSGHSDTVGCDPDLWASAPWRLEVREGRAFGLGACDMKGFLACALAAAAKLATSGRDAALSRGLGILITCDEETSMAGAAAAAPRLKALGLAPELVVIGEPTLMTPVFGHKGYMGRSLTVTGRACHSSDPDRGVSAAHGAARAILQLEALAKRLRDAPDARDPDFAPVDWATLNVGSVHGGDSVNRVCASARIEFDVRPTPRMNAAAVRPLLAELEGALARELQASGAAAALRDLYPDLEAFVNPDRAVRARVESLAGRPGEFVAYATEASHLQALGPTVVMGPGSIAQAHGVDEFIELAELERGEAMINRLIESFAA